MKQEARRYSASRTESHKVCISHNGDWQVRRWKVGQRVSDVVFTYHAALWPAPSPTAATRMDDCHGVGETSEDVPLQNQDAIENERRRNNEEPEI